MKRAMMVIFLLLGMIVNVFAQKASKFEVYTDAGISFPIGPEDFSKYWKMGFNFGGGVGYRYPLNSDVTLITDFGFNRFSLNRDKMLQDMGWVDHGTSISGGDIAIITFSENLKAIVPTSSTKVTPYLCGGAGLLIFSVNDIVSNDGEIEGKGHFKALFSILLGGGTDIAIGERTDLFIEGKYIGFTGYVNRQIFPIKIGIKYKIKFNN